jgi:uncharacterized membrane protein YkvA (DUF1232 family)
VAKNQQTPPSSNDVAGSAIFKKFLNTAEGYIKQPSRLKKLLTDAYKKASEKNDVGTLAHEAWETLQTMFRLIKASMSGEYTGVPGTTVAAAVAVLIYFISPIDLIPDFIPVLGLLDDVALVAWFSTTLKGEMDKFHEWELTRPTEVTTAGAYAPSDKETPASAASAAATATASASNQAKHAADALDEQAAMAPAAQPSHSNDPTAPTAQIAEESAKHAGTRSVAAHTTDSSREPSTTATNTGGNVR